MTFKMQWASNLVTMKDYPKYIIFRMVHLSLAQKQVDYEGWAVISCYEPSCVHKMKIPYIAMF